MENNIVGIYKKRKYNEFLIAKNKKLGEIEDKYKSLMNEYNAKLLELLKEDKAESIYETYSVKNHFISKETQDKINEIEKEFKDSMDDRNRLIDEVEAQLQLCGSRDEMLEVFKAYGILDENNKIYDYR